jgi:Na+/phosphate symporter
MNLTERKIILNNLICFSKSLNEHKADLEKIPWDSQEDVAILGIENINKILERLSKNILSKNDIEEWANLIEVREDIGFDSEYTKLELEKLANPILFEE